MNLDLTGKNALVCGSSRGIGKAVAIELALLGANVTLLARSEPALSDTLKVLPLTKEQFHGYLVADMSSPETLAPALAKHLESRKAPYHILINNTGGPAPGPANSAAEQAFIQAFSQHLLVNHYLMQSLLTGMKESGFGRIINIISSSVKQPIPNLGVSNTIRAAVANWAKTLSLELAPFGITVNNVLPGATSTDRLDAIINNKAEKTGISPKKIMEEMVGEIPVGRFAEPGEVAAAAAFLASPAAAAINGINLPVDGGRTACL